MDDSPPLNGSREWTRGDRWILAAIVVFAFALRLVAVLQYEDRHPNAEHLSIDEAAYDRWASAIAGGDWIGKEVFFQEPLYAYSLGALYAVFGTHPIAVRVVQCALWAATAALAALLARRLFGRAAGWIAAAGIALYWPGLLFPALLLKENLFLPLFALFVLLLLKSREADEDRAATGSRRLWLATGIVAGLGSLLRGNMLVLLPVFAIWPIVRSWRRGAAIGPAVQRGWIFLAGSACILLPVALRNLAVGGVFLPTTSGAGTNLYGGNNLENPYGRATEPTFVRGIPEHEAADWRREAERRLGRPLDPGEVSAYWRGETLRSVRENPSEHLKILWRKLRLSLGRYEVPDNHCLYWDARFVPIARLPWPGFGVVGALGLAGIVLLLLRQRSRDPGAAVEVLLVFLAYLGTIVLTVTSDRARLPLAILLAPFAAWALVWTARAIAGWNQGALVRLAFAGFVGLSAVHLRVLPAAEIAEDLDERDYNLAVQYLRAGDRTADARSIAERLALEHPRSARSRILLAEIEFRSGGALDAALAKVEPLAREPSLNARERFRAESLCAWIHLERGAWSAAVESFRSARTFDGDDRDLREGLARALLATSGAGPGADGRATAEEALALLGELRTDENDSRAATSLEILLAQAEFLRGRAILAQPPASDGDRELGQTSVQAALKRLQPLADSKSLPPNLRRRSRELGGAIQLYRGNWKPAENHFRAALALGGGAEDELGLLQALLGSLGEAAADADRGRKLEEAERLLAGLEAADPGSSAVLEARERFDRVR